MNLNFIDYSFLIPLFVIGLTCSYTDIKYGKIFNKVIMAGILYALFLYLTLFFNNLFFLHNKDNFYYLFETVLNGLISLIVGYLIWYFKLWSAGDAKLFTVYALLVPLNFYSKNHVLYFPSLILLINLFVPLFLALMFDALLALIKETHGLKQKLKEFRNLNFKVVFKKLKPLSNEFFSMFLSYVFMFILFQLITNFFKKFPGQQIFSNRFFLFFLLLLIMNRFMSIKKKKKSVNFFINGVSVIYCSSLLFLKKIGTLNNILRTALVFMVFMGFIRYILDSYIKKKEIERVKIKDFKKGMIILPEEAASLLDRLKTEEEKESFSWIDGGGLNSNQVKIIKNLFRDEPQSSIRIYKTFSFAPFMLLAAVLLIFTQNSFLVTIDTFLKVLLK
jgi:Flp pilus assembly protein protease CpaA